MQKCRVVEQETILEAADGAQQPVHTGWLRFEPPRASRCECLEFLFGQSFLETSGRTALVYLLEEQWLHKHRMEHIANSWPKHIPQDASSVLVTATTQHLTEMHRPVRIAEIPHDGVNMPQGGLAASLGGLRELLDADTDTKSKCSLS